MATYTHKRQLQLPLTNCPQSNGNAVFQAVFNTGNFNFANIDSGWTDLQILDSNNNVLSPTLTGLVANTSATLLIQSVNLTGGAGTVTNSFTMNYGTTAQSSPFVDTVYTEPGMFNAQTGLCNFVPSPNFGTTNGSTQVDSTGSVTFTLVSTSATVTVNSTPLDTPNLSGATVPWTGGSIKLAATGSNCYLMTNSMTAPQFGPFTMRFWVVAPANLSASSGYQSIFTTNQNGSVSDAIQWNNNRIYVYGRQNGINFTSNATFTAGETVYFCITRSTQSCQLWTATSSSAAPTLDTEQSINAAYGGLQNGNASIWYFGFDGRSGQPPAYTAMTFGPIRIDNVAYGPSRIAADFLCTKNVKLELFEKLAPTLQVQPSPTWAGQGDSEYALEFAPSLYNASGNSWFSGNPTMVIPYGGVYIGVSSETVASYATLAVPVGQGGTLAHQSTWTVGEGSGGYASTLSGVTLYPDPDGIHLDLYGINPGYNTTSGTEIWAQYTSFAPGSAPSFSKIASLAPGALTSGCYCNHVDIVPQSGGYAMMTDIGTVDGNNYATLIATAPNLNNGGTWSYVGASTINTTSVSVSYSRHVTKGTLYYVSTGTEVDLGMYTGASFGTESLTQYSSSNVYGTCTLGNSAIQNTNPTILGPIGKVGAMFGNQTIYNFPGVETGFFGQGFLNYTSATSLVLWSVYWNGDPDSMITDGVVGSVTVGTEQPYNTGNLMTFTGTVSCTSGNTYTISADMALTSVVETVGITIFAPSGADVAFQLMGRTQAGDTPVVLADGDSFQNSGLVAGTPGTPPYVVPAGGTNTYSLDVPPGFAVLDLQFKHDAASTQSIPWQLTC